MVAVCVVAHTVFPITVSVSGVPGDPGRLAVQVRQENGELTMIELSAERSSQIRVKHGASLDSLYGRSWAQVLAEL